MRTYLFSFMLALAGLLGYLAYQTNTTVERKRLEFTRLQNTAKKANQEADYLLQRLEKRDEGELLAMLQKMRPTVGIADAAGKFIKMPKAIPQSGDLYARIMIDSVLLARFPNMFRYKVLSHSLISCAGGHRWATSKRKDDKIVCEHIQTLYYHRRLRPEYVILEGAKGELIEVVPVNGNIFLMR